MYNEKLAFEILVKLNGEFPRKVQLDDLRQVTSDFSNAPEEEWLIATDALIKLGRAKAGVIRHGMSDIPGVIANIEITDEGREFLSRARHPDGELVVPRLEGHPTIELSAPILLCRERRNPRDISSVDIRIRFLFRASDRRQTILRQSVGRARHLGQFFGPLHLLVI